MKFILQGPDLKSESTGLWQRTTSQDGSLSSTITFKVIDKTRGGVPTGDKLRESR